MNRLDNYFDGYHAGLKDAIKVIVEVGKKIDEKRNLGGSPKKNGVLPIPLDPLGYTREEVEAIIEAFRPSENYGSFLTFMRGQTIAIGHDERGRYYKDDVLRFINEGRGTQVYD